ncbi:MAG: hypothetical protein II793_03245 [Bacteroidales bacterium]|nr:hypothetical protein [Bacteroidales bacterium]
MKNIFFILIVLLLPAILWAQAPQAFGYQAIVVNADNTLIANQQIGLRISLLPGSADAEPLYSETHAPTTNANGLFSIEIGRGTPISALPIDSVDWTLGTYFLKSEIDPEGGSNYTIVSTMQLMSVPYALHANTASSLVGFADSLKQLRAQRDIAIASLTNYYDSIIAALTNAADSTHHDIVEPDSTDRQQQPLFTVAEGRTVLFAPANLQYQASTATWRFAPHQYDIAGNDNTHISSTYDGWIDLFGWGTSGWASGANVYKPFATSTDATDYFVGGSAANDLTGNHANADWGVYNTIANNSTVPQQWRTPTSNEWQYLLTERHASIINNIEDARFIRAIVGGIQGLIIFPDEFAYPIGIEEPVDSLINNLSASPFSTSYTIYEWDALEADGAVFLPVGGYRDGTRLLTNPPTGYYWSSTHYTPQWAYSLMFNANEVIPKNGTQRQRGCYVRLIHDVASE